MAKRLRELIINPEPARGRFGTNPTNPWSAKAGLTEDKFLDYYLSKLGYNPANTPKNLKVAHSKTLRFLKWKRDHQNLNLNHVEYEGEPLVEKKSLRDYLIARGMNPDYVPLARKIGHAKSQDFISWQQHQEETENVEEDLTLRRSPTQRRVNKIQQSFSSHQEIKTPRGSLRRDKSLDEEELNEDPNPNMDTRELHKYVRNLGWQLVRQDGPHYVYRHPKSKQPLAIPKHKNIPLPTKRGILKIAHALSEEIIYEDKFQDSYAATQTVGSEINERGRKSSAAQIVKRIRREKMQEDMHDWEKEDKSVQTYGKKPNHEKSDEKDQPGEKKPEARAMLSGGTTLTGSKRDTIEIDPLMRVRPGQPDPTKKEDNKKDNNKQKKK